MNKLKITILIFLSSICGFLLGRLSLQKNANFEIVEKEITPEISLVKFNQIKGDELFVDIAGKARILWGEKNLVENDGDFRIPLSQIPTENDLDYKKFAFVGNEKTMKFYPSDTYFARGVAVQYRRFFNTKEDAIAAGFIPSKSVK